eukprot:TRINITY_DN4083_c0_g1_i2.p1 TRINITY_DN4083_c0_g1~~TRINITY_DN4083_c0_g1_i2.p1  ORF type:complete len:826 (-),score=311.75 TRINITY_DN4083_c0_g1_i2:40-2517(-)
MGILYDNLNDRYWKNRTVNEMAFRVAKGTLRTLMRSAMERVGLPTEEPYIRVVVDYLNLLLGTSTSSTGYWANEMKYSIILSFFYHQLPPSNSAESSMAIMSSLPLFHTDLLLMVDKERLLRELVERTGIVLQKAKSNSNPNNVIQNQQLSEAQFAQEFRTALWQEKPFNEMDIISILPTTKPLDLLQISEAFMLFLKPNRSKDNLRTIAATLNDFSSSTYARCSSYLIPLYCSESYFLLLLELLQESPFITAEMRVAERRIISKINSIITDSSMFNAACKVDPFFYEALYRMIFEAAQLAERIIKSTGKDQKHLHTLSSGAHSALSVFSPQLDGKVQAVLHNSMATSNPHEWKISLLYGFMSKAAKTLVIAYSVSGNEQRFREFQIRMRNMKGAIPSSYLHLFSELDFLSMPPHHIALVPISTTFMIKQIEYLLSQKPLGQDLLNGKLRPLLRQKKYFTILRHLREERKRRGFSGRSPVILREVMNDELFFWLNIVAVFAFHYQEKKTQIMKELRRTYQLLQAHPLMSEVDYITQSANAEEQITKIEIKLEDMKKKREIVLATGLPIATPTQASQSEMSIPPFDDVKAAWKSLTSIAVDRLEPICKNFFKNFIVNLIEKINSKYSGYGPTRLFHMGQVSKENIQHYAVTTAESFSEQFFREELPKRLVNVFQDVLNRFADHLQNYNMNESFKNIFLACFGYHVPNTNFSYIEYTTLQLTTSIEQKISELGILTKRISQIKDLEMGKQPKNRLDLDLDSQSWMELFPTFLNISKELTIAHLHSVILVRTFTGFENYVQFMTQSLKNASSSGLSSPRTSTVRNQSE